ncbi:DUF4911 domain-containing protein [Caviibacter abscessus]|uniref:DUF4911 domain-containing protein n=1 Tax=Caviibacter abscessus TaxID=1766719 RepID=UPI00083631EF|nr:DUF4911 domain-containing protein [Caviibacter abscessus]
MIDYEYIIEVGRENIDIINKITEAYDGIGNVRTIDNRKGIVKILTNKYFFNDINLMFKKIKKVFNIEIKIINENEWQGEI